MRGFRRVVLVVLSFAVLTACGGGARGAAVPGSPVAQSAARQPVTLTIDVPTRTGASNKRHPQYISPATTQLAVNIQSGCPGACASASGYPTTVALTPTSNGCSSTLASTQCVLVLSLLPGSYVGTFTTLDAGGATLSTATTVPISVVAGTANRVAVSLSGVPASLVTSVLSTGAAKTTILISALDADSNVIIGPGAPSYTVAQSGTAVQLAQPTVASPNIFTVVPSSAGTTQMSVTASYASSVTNACGGTIGGVCATTANLTIAGSTLFFLACENGGPGDNGMVEQFGLPLGGAAISSSSPGKNSEAVAFGPNGDAFVANNNGGTAGGNVTVLAPPFTGAPIQTISSGLNAPTGVAFDSHGNLFVSDQAGGGFVAEYAPPYTGAPIATIGYVGTPFGIALDAAGDLFVADFYGPVREIAPPYTGGAVATISNGLDEPNGVAVAPNGNLFVSDFGFDAVFEYAPPYTGAPIASASDPGGHFLGGVTLDASGNLYTVDSYTAEVLTIAAPYTGALTPVFSGGSGTSPAGVAFRGMYTVTIGS